jgi:hypothetical protein
MSAGDLSSDETPIDTALVRGLIAGQFPRWARLPVAPAGFQGVDNATYRLGERMSVRLPRFARWDGQVAREQRWLPLQVGPAAVRTFARFAVHLSPEDAAEMDRRILEILDEYISTDSQRLDQPAHGGIIVLHQLAD